MAILTLRRALPRIACLIAVAIVGGGARQPPSEREVEAAFLCSFAEFVDWPGARADDPVRVLVLGDDPFGKLLEQTVASRPLHSKSIEIRRSSHAEEAREVEMVYVGTGDPRRVAEILDALGGASVLTVGDISGFAAMGGTIGFVVEDKRVHFEINTGAAERAHLRISSRLLSLARIVDTPPRGGG